MLHTHHWISLGPSDETGVLQHCYGCNEDRFVEAPTCYCNERDKKPQPMGRNCMTCGLLIKGLEEW